MRSPTQRGDPIGVSTNHHGQLPFLFKLRNCIFPFFSSEATINVKPNHNCIAIPDRSSILEEVFSHLIFLSCGTGVNNNRLISEVRVWYDLVTNFQILQGKGRKQV